MNYTVVDFETANSYHTSACALGLIRIEDGKEIFRGSWLLRPEPFVFNSINVAIHGITEDDCLSAQSFAELYPSISHYFENQIIVAHNASFDISVFRRTLEAHNIPVPDFRFLCTFRMAQSCYPQLPSHRLNILCLHLGIPLQHHDALSDTVACDELFRTMCGDCNDLDSICQRTSVSYGYYYSGEERYEIDGVYYSYQTEDYAPCRSVSVQDKHPNHQKRPLCNPTEIHLDEDFCGKNIVFTGTLLSMTREQATSIVVSGGGSVQTGISKKTDYLITGLQDIRRLNGHSESSKLRKAKALREAGSDIRIIGEDEFIKMIDEELWNLFTKEEKS